MTKKWTAKLTADSVDDQVEALRQISTQDAVSGLAVTVVRLCGSSDDEVRMWSAEALEVAIQPEPSEVEGLIELLSAEDDGEISYWAATMLGRLGKDAVAAVATLGSCLRDSMYLAARERAAWALAEVGPAAADALESLKQVSETGSPRLQRLALEAIEAIDQQNSEQEGQQQGGEELAA